MAAVTRDHEDYDLEEDDDLSDGDTSGKHREFDAVIGNRAADVIDLDDQDALMR